MNLWLQKRIRRLHSDESGAIMLLLLASFLILFMVAMSLYDTGVAARDKMDAQISADASAFSHSVVKSRSMNMISYANTIKRMFFTYGVTWVNGFTALLVTTVWHVSKCFRTIPRFRSCWELIENALLIIAETLEAIPNIQTLSLIGNGRTGNELEALERYQQYMFKITPWWAWTENVIRSTDNGALVTSAWPPPGSVIDEVKGAISSTVSTADFLFGSDLMSVLPSHTDAVDVLPVARRDSIVAWEDSFGPFAFELQQGALFAAGQYCVEWTGSLEMIMQTVQTMQSEAGEDYEKWKGNFRKLQLPFGSLGCAAVTFAWHLQVRSAYLDWKLNDTKFDSENKWLLSTSNFTYSYVPRAGRSSDDGARKKFNYVNKEYGGIGATKAYKKDGYFAVARSEIVYKKAGGTTSDSFLGGVVGALGSIPGVGSRLGLQEQPDMWSPRWTAKLRPMTLPGESWGAASLGDDTAGFDTVVTDSIPYLILASTLGLFDDNFSIGSALGDMMHLWASSRSMTADKVEGFSK